VQFALPGADEDLRRQRMPQDDAPRAQVLSAVDPASPYGALLPWPERDGVNATGRLTRTAGAYVVLHQGALVGYLQRTGGSLTTFGPEPHAARERALANGLALWAQAQPLRRAFQLATIDGSPAADHAASVAFQEAGFIAAGGGLLLRLGDRVRDPRHESSANPDRAEDAEEQ